MKQTLIAAFLITLISCSKIVGMKEPTCRFGCLLSDKYTPDSFYLKTDTLWGWGNMEYVCGRDLDTCLARPERQWSINCWDRSLECLRYVFDRKITQPIYFK